MESTEKISNSSVSTIWRKIIIGDEIVLLNIHKGKVKYRLFDLEFKVLSEDRSYEDDEVSEVVSDWLKSLTRAAVATAAWDARRRKHLKNGVDGSEKN